MVAIVLIGLVYDVSKLVLKKRLLVLGQMLEAQK
jgi:hypothetical protein